MNDVIRNSQIAFGEISPFSMTLNYIEINADSPKNVYDSHIHDCCEIYINLTGDVSFMVENHLYPVSYGNAVITRPFEYHHCVYNSNALHKHFWILFSADGNEHLFDMFFDRKKGQGNLVVLTTEDAAELIRVCKSMIDEKLTEFQKYAGFFEIISLLSGKKATEEPDAMPEDVRQVIDFMNMHLSEQLTVQKFSEISHVSINTLERHFRDALKLSPYEYLKNKRLANAAVLLKKGKSVTEAALESGYTNCSHFIVLFKKAFGVTPYKYKTEVK